MSPLSLKHRQFTTLTAYMQSFIHENDNEVFSTQSIINILVYRQDITIPHLNRL